MEHKKIILRTVATLWTIGITALSLISLPSIGVSFPVQNKDKIVHFMFYFVFVILWSLSYKKTASIKNSTILIAAVFYGAVLEFLQGLTGFRTADFYDFLANTIGAISGFIIVATTRIKN